MKQVSCQISDLHVNSSQRYKNNKLVTDFVNTLLRSRYAVYHSSKHSFHFIRVDFFQHDVKGHQILCQKPKFQGFRFSRFREIKILMRGVSNGVNKIGHFVLRFSGNCPTSGV